MLKFPNEPARAANIKDISSLAEMRNALNSIDMLDSGLESRILSCLKSQGSSLYKELSKVLDDVRGVENGKNRLIQMNTIVRTIGEPDNLVKVLSSIKQQVNSGDNSLSNITNVKMHSIYGWCGNTLLIESSEEPSPNTFPAPNGIELILGNPTSTWNLTLHIWQPNSKAQGFEIASLPKPKSTILEPPHSHPFSFSSFIVKGELHQSLYVDQLDKKRVNENRVAGYYDSVPLIHSDGVWPPHSFEIEARVETIEHRTCFRKGDSYYMPANWIHDVEIDGDRALRQPTITLFLSTEYITMPHVYVHESMVKYHNDKPTLKSDNSGPISLEKWNKKIDSLINYIGNEEAELNLPSIIEYDKEYAFFHV